MLNSLTFIDFTLASLSSFSSLPFLPHDSNSLPCWQTLLWPNAHAFTTVAQLHVSAQLQCWWILRLWSNTSTYNPTFTTTALSECFLIYRLSKKIMAYTYTSTLIHLHSSQARPLTLTLITNSVLDHITGIWIRWPQKETSEALDELAFLLKACNTAFRFGDFRAYSVALVSKDGNLQSQI